MENEFSLRNMDALNKSSLDFVKANNAASMQDAANSMAMMLADAQQSVSQYSTDVQRQTSLDQIASTLVRSGVDNGVFATADGAANWISMIGEIYPDMGLSVTTALAQDSAVEVV